MTRFPQVERGSWSSTILLVTLLLVVGSTDCNIVQLNGKTAVVGVEDVANNLEKITMLETLDSLLSRLDLEFQEEMHQMKVENEALVQSLREENQELGRRLREESKKVNELELKNHDQAVTIEQLKETFSQLELQSTDSNNNGLKKETRKWLNNIAETPNAQSSVPQSTFRGMPTGCEELSLIGHTLNGFYSVKAADNTKISSVYCDFSQLPLVNETRVGYIDVKSTSTGVYFYVQKNQAYSQVGVIPFDFERLNQGGAMNIETGIFTAPVNGIYHFSFIALKPVNGVYLEVFLRKNDVDVGVAFTQENGNPSNYLTVTVQSTLALKKGDEISMFNNGGYLYDYVLRHTHFTGWLIEEDLLLE